jgi:hypothetical protein
MAEKNTLECRIRSLKIKLVLFILLGLSLNGLTQETKSKHIIKADIVQPVLYLLRNSSAYSLSYEHQLKNNHGVQLSFLHATDKNLTGSYKTFQVVPCYKYYINPSYKNYFLGAYAKYINYHVEGAKTNPNSSYDDSYELVQLKAAFGLTNGFLFLFGERKRLALEPSLGVGFSQVMKTQFIKKGNYSYQNTKLDGIISLEIGYSF